MDPENLIWVSIEISFLLEKDEVVVWESFISLESRGCCGPSLGPGEVCALPAARWSHGHGATVAKTK